jgi:hypothetical protein
MIQLTQQLDNNATLTQTHYDMASISEVKKFNLAYKLGVIEIEMQKPVKDWNKIAFLKTEIAKMKNYIKNNK